MEAKLCAEWIPGWYNLDVSIAVGERRRWLFWDDTDLALANATPARTSAEPDAVFYNTLLSAGPAHWRLATVAGIRHRELGELRSVRTRFGTYDFEDVTGRVWQVESEEGPGVCVEARHVVDWSVTVTLTDVGPADPADHLQT